MAEVDERTDVLPVIEIVVLHTPASHMTYQMTRTRQHPTCSSITV